MGTAQSKVSTGRQIAAVGLGTVGKRLEQFINACANIRCFYEILFILVNYK